VSLDVEASERIYFHDLLVEDVHRGLSAHPDNPIIALGTNDWEGSAGQSVWLALENIHFFRIGGYVFTEYSDNAAFENGPIRLKNLTAEWDSCSVLECGSGAAPAFSRTPGYFEKVEILDSVFEGNIEDPFLGDDPDGSERPATALSVGECNREFTIRNNTFRGFATAVRVEANTTVSTCSSRDVTDIVIDGNVFTASDFEQMSRVTVPFYVGDRQVNGQLDAHVGKVHIVNNAVIAEHGWRACIGVRATEGGSGAIVVEHNTCIGALADPTQNTGHVWLRVPLDPLPMLSNVAVRNNLFAGANPDDVAVLVGAAPTGWQADNNVFDPKATFVWSGNAMGFAGWRAMTGGDAASDVCVPQFVDAGEFHLANADTCAAEHGAESQAVTKDIDLDDRPMGPNADVGADERR
jgi:hypothetical protein